MTKPDHEPLSDDVEDAISVTATVCGCPHIHIVLFDDIEEPFARALLTPAQLGELVRNVERQLGHKLPDGLPGGRHG